MLITFIRHGRVAGRPYVFRGRSDCALSDEGWTQLQRAACNWDAPPIEQLYTSPRKRCEAFAQQWARARDVRCATLTSLAEIDFGAWEELSVEEARTRDPDCFDAMTTDLENWSAPGGESYRNFRTRIMDGLDEIVRAGGGHAGVLTHGGVIRVVLSGILDIRPQFAQRIVIDYGSVCRIWYASRQDAALMSLSDTRCKEKQTTDNTNPNCRP